MYFEVAHIDLNKKLIFLDNYFMMILVEEIKIVKIFLYTLLQDECAFETLAIVFFIP